MSTRRHFLCLSSAALATTAVPKAFAQRASMPVFSNASLGAYAQGTMTRSVFERLVGSSFRLFLEDGRVANLVLLNVASPAVTKKAMETVSSARTANRPTPEQCFQVKFSSGSVAVPQGSYVADHATLGGFSLFVVPGKDSGMNTCTSTFYYL